MFRRPQGCRARHRTHTHRTHTHRTHTHRTHTHRRFPTCRKYSAFSTNCPIREKRPSKNPLGIFKSRVYHVQNHPCWGCRGDFWKVSKDNHRHLL